MPRSRQLGQHVCGSGGALISGRSLVPGRPVPSLRKRRRSVIVPLSCQCVPCTEMCYATMTRDRDSRQMPEHPGFENLLASLTSLRCRVTGTKLQTHGVCRDRLVHQTAHLLPTSCSAHTTGWALMSFCGQRNTPALGVRSAVCSSATSFRSSRGVVYDGRDRGAVRGGAVAGAAFPSLRTFAPAPTGHGPGGGLGQLRTHVETPGVDTLGDPRCRPPQSADNLLIPLTARDR